MPSENNPEVQYELFEDKKAIKFMDNHSNDEKLIKRIYDKYSYFVKVCTISFNQFS